MEVEDEYSPTSSSSDSSSDSETDDKGDNTSCYSPGEDGESSSDEGYKDSDSTEHMSVTTKFDLRFQETMKQIGRTKNKNGVILNNSTNCIKDIENQYVADKELKENVATKPAAKRRCGNVGISPARKRGQKPGYNKTTTKKTNFKSKVLDLFGNAKKSTAKPKRTRKPRPCLSEIILGVRKKGRAKKHDQRNFFAIRTILDDFKRRFSFTPAKGPQTSDPNAPLSKYVTYQKASLTPHECYVEMKDVLEYFSKDIQEYLISGLTLFNVNSIPIAQANPNSSSIDKNEKISSQLSKKQIKKDINVDDIVWARHKNGRYYEAQVMETKAESNMCVFFPEDQSFSKDVRLTDIVGRGNIKKPIIGQRLQIRWVDGKVYDADYIGNLQNYVFTVLFEDDSRNSLHREHIFSLHEPIPKRIVPKLSYATDMKNRDHLYGLERPLPEKRPRGNRRRGNRGSERL